MAVTRPRKGMSQK